MVFYIISNKSYTFNSFLLIDENIERFDLDKWLLDNTLFFNYVLRKFEEKIVNRMKHKKYNLIFAPVIVSTALLIYK